MSWGASQTKWHPIPYIVHCIWTEPYGGHRVNRVPCRKKPWLTACLAPPPTHLRTLGRNRKCRILLKVGEKDEINVLDKSTERRMKLNTLDGRVLGSPSLNYIAAVDSCCFALRWGPLWAKTAWINLVSTSFQQQKFNVKTLKQHGKLIGFAKSHQHKGDFVFAFHPTFTLNPVGLWNILPVSNVKPKRWKRLCPVGWLGFITLLPLRSALCRVTIQLCYTKWSSSYVKTLKQELPW